MFDLSKLPWRTAESIKGLPWRRDSIGRSGSTILLFEEMVLKIEKISRSSINEQKLLVWLAGRLPVPEILLSEAEDGYSFLLMTRLHGEMACSDGSLERADETVAALADALKMLWRIDISTCPCLNDVNGKLIEARRNIDGGLVDINDFDPETFTTEGFSDALGLYRALEKNRPVEDKVFSHGDFCLPNILVSNGRAAGFIDWGNGGVADRWQDIALCVRSLRMNLLARPSCCEAECSRHVEAFFSALGISPDEEKMRYYRLLDELF